VGCLLDTSFATDEHHFCQIFQQHHTALDLVIAADCVVFLEPYQRQREQRRNEPVELIHIACVACTFQQPAGSIACIMCGTPIQSGITPDPATPTGTKQLFDWIQVDQLTVTGLTVYARTASNHVFWWGCEPMGVGSSNGALLPGTQVTESCDPVQLAAQQGSTEATLHSSLVGCLLQTTNTPPRRHAALPRHVSCTGTSPSPPPSSLAASPAIERLRDALAWNALPTKSASVDVLAVVNASHGLVLHVETASQAAQALAQLRHWQLISIDDFKQLSDVGTCMCYVISSFMLMSPPSIDGDDIFIVRAHPTEACSTLPDEPCTGC
jgi:hypothetical protein